jgi:hypothetical protein
MGAMAGVCVPGEHLVLEAIAAERMPHRIAIWGVARAPFFELRDYGSAAPQMTGLLHRHGIRVVLEENGRFLFPFESLASREASWRGVSADLEWVGLREGAVPHEIAVYRVL